MGALNIVRTVRTSASTHDYHVWKHERKGGLTKEIAVEEGGNEERKAAVRNKKRGWGVIRGEERKAGMRGHV